ncbi:glycosyltransferase family 2 protein [Brunnivagina elsteri]|uniref:Glycosyl transferase n=1 Tax=Brunnivagina elsteri CCALA 953 TaxID=987040 RepID=A0A2A2TNC3_9CYAN|nr:glycosyltransferase family 2 protein [Calothrix elsteri]PAX60011.1 glycosyl transferase [Calothrix elsteri CCALA 953]
MHPLVSIGMPIFNCEITLISAIKSILNQTYRNWELILLDDGSQDKTLSIAQSFPDSRIKVITDKLNLKLPSRLNQAIAISNGKYFARMDGDDISYPERLQKQVEYLESNPEIDLLGTQFIVFDRYGNAKGKFKLKESHSEICSRPWSGIGLGHPTWMGKTEWFRTHQYRPKAIRMEDQDLLLRTFFNSKFACLPDILFGYRVDNLSLKKSLIGRYNLSIALVEQAWIQKNYLLAFGVLEQLVKASVDIFAITTGLNFKLLKHRNGSFPLSEDDLSKWQEIWSECSKEANLKVKI